MHRGKLDIAEGKRSIQISLKEFHPNQHDIVSRTPAEQHPAHKAGLEKNTVRSGALMGRGRGGDCGTPRGKGLHPRGGRTGLEPRALEPHLELVVVDTVLPRGFGVLSEQCIVLRGCGTQCHYVELRGGGGHRGTGCVVVRLPRRVRIITIYPRIIYNYYTDHTFPYCNLRPQCLWPTGRPNFEDDQINYA